MVRITATIDFDQTGIFDSIEEAKGAMIERILSEIDLEIEQGDDFCSSCDDLGFGICEHCGCCVNCCDCETCNECGTTVDSHGLCQDRDRCLDCCVCIEEEKKDD